MPSPHPTSSPIFFPSIIAINNDHLTSTPTHNDLTVYSIPPHQFATVIVCLPLPCFFVDLPLPCQLYQAFLIVAYATRFTPPVSSPSINQARIILVQLLTLQPHSHFLLSPLLPSSLNFRRSVTCAADSINSLDNIAVTRKASRQLLLSASSSKFYASTVFYWSSLPGYPVLDVGHCSISQRSQRTGLLSSSASNLFNVYIV